VLATWDICLENGTFENNPSSRLVMSKSPQIAEIKMAQGTTLILMSTEYNEEFFAERPLVKAASRAALQV
jgi:hypothetical protein